VAERSAAITAPDQQVSRVSRVTSRVPPGERDNAIEQRRVTGQLPWRTEWHIRADRGVGAGDLRVPPGQALGWSDDVSLRQC
jgi:hypothetical protein